MPLIQILVTRYRRWSELREAQDELHAMTDRDLADIGINRSDIARLVREQQHGAEVVATALPLSTKGLK
jgi:uncharacterized protein YjiS (DUF1127 family)